MSLRDEFEVIRLIQATVGKPSRRVELGIGDDAAVTLPPREKLVATVDTMVEGVHFDLSYMTARELGHKALAVNLSDIAAMGAEPLYALVSLGLKQDMQEYFIEEFYRGLKLLAKRFGVDVIGGNLVQSPQTVLVDITLIGQANSYATRAGAQPNDLIAVTGDLGSSAAGLSCLKRLGRSHLDDFRALVKAHLTPEPRVEEGAALVETGGVTAMLDISDGFARDLHHICEQSKVGALIEEAKLPISKLTHKAAELISGNAKAWALYGGEDYELLLTLDPKRLAAAQKALKPFRRQLHVIGKILPQSKGVRLKGAKGLSVPLEPRGWNHFVRRARIKGDPDPTPL